MDIKAAKKNELYAEHRRVRAIEEVAWSAARLRLRSHGRDEQTARLMGEMVRSGLSEFLCASRLRNLSR